MAWVQSLVGELRSHKTQGTAKKKKKKSLGFHRWKLVSSYPYPKPHAPCYTGSSEPFRQHEEVLSGSPGARKDVFCNQGGKRERNKKQRFCLVVEKYECLCASYLKLAQLPYAHQEAVQDTKTKLKPLSKHYALCRLPTQSFKYNY